MEKSPFEREIFRWIGADPPFFIAVWGIPGTFQRFMLFSAGAGGAVCDFLPAVSGHCSLQPGCCLSMFRLEINCVSVPQVSSFTDFCSTSALRGQSHGSLCLTVPSPHWPSALREFPALRGSSASRGSQPHGTSSLTGSPASLPPPSSDYSMRRLVAVSGKMTQGRNCLASSKSIRA